jgi:hypothetical protein
LFVTNATEVTALNGMMNWPQKGTKGAKKGNWEIDAEHEFFFCAFCAFLRPIRFAFCLEKKSSIHDRAAPPSA